MTYRELQKHLGRLTAEQLDNDIVIEVGDFFYKAEEGINIASGKGDYLYANEPFLSVDSEPMSEKEFDEEEE
jgi:hypothetical protein